MKIQAKPSTRRNTFHFQFLKPKYYINARINFI